MSPEQVFIRQLDAFVRGDLDEFVEYWSPDCTFRDITEPEPRRGRAQLREYMARWLQDMTDVEVRIATLFGNGDRALAELVQSGTWRGGTPITLNVCVVDVIRDGLVQTETVYWDSRQLSAQLER